MFDRMTALPPQAVAVLGPENGIRSIEIKTIVTVLDDAGDNDKPGPWKNPRISYAGKFPQTAAAKPEPTDEEDEFFASLEVDPRQLF